MRWIALLLLFLLPSVSAAQTVQGDRVRLSGGPCVLEGGDGTPDKLVLTGNCSGIVIFPIITHDCYRVIRRSKLDQTEP